MRLREVATGQRLWAALLVAWIGGAVGWLSGCSGWDPTDPFTHNAPEVDEALGLMDAGEFKSAEEVLREYLGTGKCGDAGMRLPESVRDKSSGAWDLGLTLFHLAEKYGKRFGDEEEEDDDDDDRAEYKAARRSGEIDCAQIIVKAIANDQKVPLDLRARAFYLSGNLEFLRAQYAEAVRQYDEALRIVPGVDEEAETDAVGRDAAWNRAIALRRLEEEQDAGPDAGDDGGDDAGDDGGEDAGDDGGDDAGDDGGDDAGDDGGGDDGGEDAGDDGGGDDGGEDAGGGDEDAGDAGGEDGGDDGGNGDQPDAGDQNDTPPDPGEGNLAEPPESSDDERMDEILGELEDAPTYQEEKAKKDAARGRRGGMEDK